MGTVSPFARRVDLPARKPENTVEPPPALVLSEQLLEDDLPILEKCCEAECWARWKDHEPCYGRVQVIAEDKAKDRYIHGCAGHPEHHGKYVLYRPGGSDD